MNPDPQTELAIAQRRAGRRKGLPGYHAALALLRLAVLANMAAQIKSERDAT